MFMCNLPISTDSNQVEELLCTYHTNRTDWKKFAKFDPYKYTRNLVHEGNGKFNLMLLCWAPGNQSSIHDHADAHCFVKNLDGVLKEVIIIFWHFVIYNIIKKYKISLLIDYNYNVTSILRLDTIGQMKNQQRMVEWSKVVQFTSRY